LRDEALEYLSKDLRTLYEIILKVRTILYDEFNLDVTKVLSAPSLSFKIFRSNFLTQVPPHLKEKEFQLGRDEWEKEVKGYTPRFPVITGKLFNDLSKAYYGGLVDVTRRGKPLPL
jgi:hypothetical protein